MAGSESPILEAIQYPSGQSPLPKEVEGKPQVASVMQERQKSKVSKFGAWEGGENYTHYFDNAQKKKTNGQMINLIDPEENQEMFQQKGGPAQAPRADPKGLQAEVPQFGAWENGENVGYTAYFENKRKGKNGEPTASQNEPKMNRDLHPRKDPPAQSRPAPAKSVPQQKARSKVPQFGDWKGAGEAGYTQSVENVRKNNKNGHTVTPEPSDAPQLNRDVNDPPTKEGRPKVPQFGAWEEGDNGGVYTAYFENARKNKNAKLDPIEPQLNRDVNNRAQPPSAAGTKNMVDDHQLRNASRGSASSVAVSDTPSRHGKQNPGGHSPIHQKARKLQQRSPANRGSQTPERGATIPAWGVWNTDPQQAEGFTGTFTRAKEERNTPLNSNVPPRYQQLFQEGKGERNELVNGARFPLVSEGMLAERAGALARAGDPHVYGGSISLTAGKTGGNGNDVDQLGITSRGFLVSTAGRNTALRKEIKLLQPNQGAKKSQVSITSAGMILDNDTPESYHLPTHHSNQEEKKGSCFPWFGRGRVKTFSFLQQ